MHKMAVIGDQESILVFKAFGADVYAVEEEDSLENRKLLHRLMKQKYALILITESIAQELQEVLDVYRTKVSPAIMLIPSGSGSLGLAQKIMKQNVERAVGMDLAQPEAEEDE